MEGRITLKLRVEDARVADVSVHSTRRTDAARVLEGRGIAEALRLLPGLFSICGAAHAVAAVEACEIAWGVEPEAGTRQARSLACALEAIENHALRIALDWPRLTGGPAAVAEAKRIRLATSAIRKAVLPERDWLLPGQATRKPGPIPRELAAELTLGVESLVPPDLASGNVDVVPRGDGPARRLVRDVLTSGAASFGRTRAPLVPTLDEGWFATRLEDDTFGARPTLDGTCAEAGALARSAARPVVAQLLARRGADLITRLVATFVDLHELARLGTHVRGGPGPARGRGRGVGIAETARGTLAHDVTLEADRVMRWRTVAPTEWTFHPAGVLREALLGVSSDDLARRARWLAAALDACVPVDVEVEG